MTPFYYIRIYLPTNQREECKFDDEDYELFFEHRANVKHPTKEYVINEYNRLACLNPANKPEWLYYIP